MRFGTLLLILALLGLQPSLAQTLSVPCTLAEKIDLTSFTLLGNYDPSEAGQDRAASDYAGCQSKALTRSLSQMVELSSRMGALRTLYRQLNAADGLLASIMDGGTTEGGGTVYGHGVPRSYPEIETTLRTLAALAGSRYGGQTGAQYAASIRGSKEALTTRLSLLRGWKPSGEYPFSEEQYRAALQRYQDAANTIMKVLGSRGDAATAAGYLPLSGSLFLDDLLNNND